MADEEVGGGRVMSWAALPEAAMRAAYVGRYLASATPEEAVRTLEALLRAAICKDSPARNVAAALVDPRRLSLDQRLVLALHALASNERATLAAAYLRNARQNDADDGKLQRDHLVHRDLRKLTLGERRSLARKAKGDAAKKLLGDPDPLVIENLLQGPRVTESDVLVIASKRPTVSAPLEAVLASRFGTRYRVRLALAKNPHLLESLGQNLLVGLDAPDLEAIRDDGLLSGERRLAAQRLLDVLAGRI